MGIFLRIRLDLFNPEVPWSQKIIFLRSKMELYGSFISFLSLGKHSFILDPLAILGTQLRYSS